MKIVLPSEKLLIKDNVRISDCLFGGFTDSCISSSVEVYILVTSCLFIDNIRAKKEACICVRNALSFVNTYSAARNCFTFGCLQGEYGDGQYCISGTKLEGMHEFSQISIACCGPTFDYSERRSVMYPGGKSLEINSINYSRCCLASQVLLTTGPGNIKYMFMFGNTLQSNELVLSSEINVKNYVTYNASVLNNILISAWNNQKATVENSIIKYEKSHHVSTDGTGAYLNIYNTYLGSYTKSNNVIIHSINNNFNIETYIYFQNAMINCCRTSKFNANFGLKYKIIFLLLSFPNSFGKYESFGFCTFLYMSWHTVLAALFVLFNSENNLSSKLAIYTTYVFP